MKTIQFNLLLIFFMLPGLLQAEGIKGKYTSEKKINKSFAVNPDAMTSISNKYGNVYVTTWDENKTEIDVVITVSGNNEEQVNNRIKSIDVLFDGKPNRVSAITQLGSSSSKTSMEINYTVKIPRKGGISISNQYGGTTLGTINGQTNIDCQYGSFSAGELNSEENVIVLQYANGSNINYITKAAINAEYSGLSIKKSNQLNIKGNNTNVTIGDVGNITYALDYGNMTIGTANIVLGMGDYGRLKFGTIRTELFIKSNYSDIRVGKIEKEVKKITINTTYTNIDLKLDENYIYDFDIMTSYGNLSGGNNLTYIIKREEKFDKSYKGYYKTSGVSRMFIRSDYGNINLGKS